MATFDFRWLWISVLFSTPIKRQLEASLHITTREINKFVFFGYIANIVKLIHISKMDYWNAVMVKLVCPKLFTSIISWL